MASFWQMIKKYPYIAGILLLLFFTMLARVQGDIATLFERSLINFISGITLIICVLYGFLYISGSLNPGDKSYIDFKKISDTLLKGSSKK